MEGIGCGQVVGFAAFAAFILISLLSGFIAQRKSAQRADGPAPGGGIADTLRRALREAMGEGGPQPSPPWGEAPTPGERVRTPGEHRRTPGEHRPTPGEVGRTAAEHRLTRSEMRRTVGEHRPTLSEVKRTASEHVAGELRLPPPPPPTTPTRRRPRRAREITAELRKRDSLARAIVLREILGPPVGLRSPEEGP